MRARVCVKMTVSASCSLDKSIIGQVTGKYFFVLWLEQFGQVTRTITSHTPHLRSEHAHVHIKSEHVCASIGATSLWWWWTPEMAATP